LSLSCVLHVGAWILVPTLGGLRLSIFSFRLSVINTSSSSKSSQELDIVGNVFSELLPLPFYIRSLRRGGYFLGGSVVVVGSSSPDFGFKF
jgi:hypothetical protein